MEKQCKICNKIITCEKNNATLTKKFKKHLLNTHNIDYKEYLIQTEYNGICPTCKCGCGKDVKFISTKFNNYYADSHVKFTPEMIKKGLETKLKKGTLDSSRYLLKFELDENKLKEYFDDFMNMKKSLVMISEETGLDKRTLKKHWNVLGFITNLEDFERVIRKHQGYWRNKISIPTEEEQIIIYNKLPDIYNFIINNKGTYSIEEIKNTFNIKCRNNYFHELLIIEFGQDIIKNFNYQGKSRLEVEFYNILKFYFQNNVSKQYKIDNKYYDYILCNKILIELDGGYWHKTIEAQENDKIKNELAKKHNFIMFRIKESEIRNFKILNKLNELYEKFK